ncbi:hypothetical protein CYMTET_25418 [Cymbomonas tetramitiformis]|uniref:Uncharacterized protein n=1 Tax=Cymbomonas tetramitiformis TaxID=36881 RepID=A0AAE0FTT7_9CHLO|nr:hypothetical protein CYMTET_25418 [Cymbomonas tetramitiformis]
MGVMGVMVERSHGPRGGLPSMLIQLTSWYLTELYQVVGAGPAPSPGQEARVSMPGLLARQGGSRRIAVGAVDGWSREGGEKPAHGLVATVSGGWGVAGGGAIDGGTVEVSGEGVATGVDGQAGGVAVGSGEGVEGPHLSLPLELSGAAGGACEASGSVQLGGCGRQAGAGQQMGGGSESWGNQRAEGQAQEQPGVGGLMGDPEGLGKARWAWLRGLSFGTGKRQDVGGDRRRELQEQTLELDEKKFDDVMRNVPQASGLGSSQWRWEHLWAVHVSVGETHCWRMMSVMDCGRSRSGWR